MKKKKRQTQKRVLDTHNAYASTAVLQLLYTYNLLHCIFIYVQKQ